LPSPAPRSRRSAPKSCPSPSLSKVGVAGKPEAVHVATAFEGSTGNARRFDANGIWRRAGGWRPDK
jgi:hypothetical protein